MSRRYSERPLNGLLDWGDIFGWCWGFSPVCTLPKADPPEGHGFNVRGGTAARSQLLLISFFQSEQHAPILSEPLARPILLCAEHHEEVLGRIRVLNAF